MTLFSKQCQIMLTLFMMTMPSISTDWPVLYRISQFTRGKDHYGGRVVVTPTGSANWLYDEMSSQHQPALAVTFLPGHSPSSHGSDGEMRHLRRQ